MVNLLMYHAGMLDLTELDQSFSQVAQLIFLQRMQFQLVIV